MRNRVQGLPWTPEPERKWKKWVPGNPCLTCLSVYLFLLVAALSCEVLVTVTGLYVGSLKIGSITQSLTICVFECILSSLVREVDYLYESFQISPLGRDVSQE